MQLTDREQNIILATIRLWNVNKNEGFISDHELIFNSFMLSINEMREIRDMVQTIHKN